MVSALEKKPDMTSNNSRTNVSSRMIRFTGCQKEGSNHRKKIGEKEEKTSKAMPRK
ncbi:MAG TPA: hypothetical protein PKC67_11630 [Kiritimatiellia bacterium]|nr:hypothetical protein [Kiritimatiellia bacterium]HMP34988.1 hypothetical protein [Kiritimatiellia bacterium]